MLVIVTRLLVDRFLLNQKLNTKNTILKLSLFLCSKGCSKAEYDNFAHMFNQFVDTCNTIFGTDMVHMAGRVQGAH